nr:MAG TPA: hypothetical protein [Caudoviricetes sp.]
MNTNLPISQADLEAMRIGSAHAAAEREWSWMMTVDAVSGNLQASPDFRRALVKAGLLQDNCNIQPPMVWAPILYSYDFLFPPKETTNGKTENDRSQIDSTEPHGQIRDSASLDSDPARNQPHQRDAAQNERLSQEAESKLRAGDLRRNPESDRGSSMSKKDKISVREAYWVLGMFKKLESICLEINSLPMPLRPEIKDFRDRLRQKLREMEARERERAR